MRALRRPTISTCLFLLFILLATFTIPVRADDDNNDADEYEESARVARVSMIRGDVQLQRNGSKTWELARVNFPLVEGDTLATTGQDARLELQIDARNFVRVGGDSILRVVSLRDEGVALSLSEGVATIRLARFDHNKEYFEVDAPGTTLAAERRGIYRLDVSQTGSVRLAVRDGGQARIYSETSGFTLRDGRSAELVYNGTDAGDWELSRAESFDSWDHWVDERERYLSGRLRYEGRDRYYDSDVWGAEELDAYGEWVNTSDYGWVWRPFSTTVNNYSNWAPYRYGHWVWCPPYGWTWVGDEAWGWAPYHYGRWVYYNNNWCWAPRGYGYVTRRSWWRPALVVFVYVPTTYGERVCWYPLTYGQRDPRGRHYRRLEALRSNDAARLWRTNPAYLRAITSLPARDFGRHTVQAQQAPTEIARRVLTAEPVRGRLPIQPAEGSGTNAGVGMARAPRGIAARPPNSTGVLGTLSDRPTGAATRTPGVALDDELRRTRLYNGRELRPPRGASESNSGAGRGNSTGGNAGVVDPGNTGVIARPARVRSTDGSPSERGNQGNSGDSSTPWYERPIRPARVNPGAERGTSPTTPPPTIERPDGGDAGTTTEPAPRVRPISPRRGDGGNDGGVEPAARPARRPEARPESRPESRPEPRPEPRSERPESRPEPRPESRPEARPEPRSERPEPRSEPRPESRPEPRQEEPRQESRPESRPEPPPQREQPRSDESKPAAPAQRERDDDAPARPSKSPGNR
jgi:hypothetical protein